MDNTEVIDFDGASDQQIADEAYLMAIDLANSYGSFEGEDYEGEDEDQQIFTESDLGYHWEEYVPDKHDMYRVGGGSFLDDFKLKEGFSEWLSKTLEKRS